MRFRELSHIYQFFGGDFAPGGQRLAVIGNDRENNTYLKVFRIPPIK